MVKAQPDGYPTVSSALAVDGAAEAIAFYQSVLGATERMRMPAPGGKIAHAELQLGDSVVMVADEYPDMGYLGPHKIGGSPVTLSVYVDDVDAVYAAAIEAGAAALREPEDQFYGDRSAQFIDPWGHRWGVAQHIEDVPIEEMERRAMEMSEN